MNQDNISFGGEGDNLISLATIVIWNLIYKTEQVFS